MIINMPINVYCDMESVIIWLLQKRSKTHSESAQNVMSSKQRSDLSTSCNGHLSPHKFNYSNLSPPNDQEREDIEVYDKFTTVSVSVMTFHIDGGLAYCQNSMPYVQLSFTLHVSLHPRCSLTVRFC